MRLIIILMLFVVSISYGQQGKLTTHIFNSEILKENKVNLDTKRSIKVYLPRGYETSSKRYPVVYFLHNIFWDNDRMFADGRIVTLMDRAIATGVIKEFIMVVPDYRAATSGSLYENSPVSGRWLDHTVQEIVPFVDKTFRTIPNRDSRALVGEWLGGRGALELAITQPDVFSSVYALNPAATGEGDIPWAYTNIEWQKLYNAKSYPDNSLSHITQIFLTASQAFLPNPNRPPFYCDFYMEPVNGVPTINPKNMQTMKAGFLIGEDLSNLKKMKGVMFDWASFDQTYAHILGNRELSRKLTDEGVIFEAEEYAAYPTQKTWTDDGRFYSRVLPFLSKYLSF